MKEFKKALLLVIIWQIIVWGIFIFCDEVFPSHTFLQQYLLAIIFLIVTLIIYLIYSKKIVIKNNYNSKKFNASFLILWVVFSIALGFGIAEYGPSNPSRWLDSLQYIEFTTELILQVITIILVKILDVVCKFVKNKIME